MWIPVSLLVVVIALWAARRYVRPRLPLVTTAQASIGVGANRDGALAAEGIVSCPAPLLSPLTQRPCLYYKVTVVRNTLDATGRPIAEVVDVQSAASPFTINDGSGPVWVDASKGGDFQVETHREVTEADAPGSERLLRMVHRDQSDVVYHVEEEVLPSVSKIFVAGRVEGGAISHFPDCRLIVRALSA